MRLLVDMNLSPLWVGVLSSHGYPAIHWSEIGRADAPDTEIFAWAAANDCIVFTHDLDFGTLLRLTGARRPSVIQIRSEDIRPSTMGPIAMTAIRQTFHDLEKGALLTIHPRRNRITLLPLTK